MSRKVLAAIALVALIFGLGYPLRNWLLPDHVPAALPVLASAPGTRGSTAPASTMTVTAWQGSVERRGGAALEWQPLTADAQIRGRDALRTREGASAVLTDSDGVRLELAEKTELQLSQLDADNSRVVLNSGRMAARLVGSKAKLRVEVLGNQTVVESSQGAFAVLRNDNGQVTVATTEGRTAVSANNGHVELSAGEQSIVPVDRPPSAPSRIPASLFLKVARSGPALLNRRETDVGGKATPGAMVQVNGISVATDDQGRFKARVQLREGTNALEVTAQDVMGRVKHETLPAVRVDTEAPKLQGKLVW